MASPWCCVTLTLLVSALMQPSLARNPGISLRLSEQFFTDLLWNLASPLIQKELSSVKIPDINVHIPYINTDMFLTGMTLDPATYRLHNSTFLRPNTNLSALEAHVGVYVSGTGHWRTRTRWWPHISESGTVHFNTDPMWTTVAISMDPGANGLWNFTLAKFSTDCGLKVKFTGDGMSGIDVGALRNDINKIANEDASSEITTVVTKILDGLTPIMKKYLPYLSFKNCSHFSIPGCEDFALNLSLSDPVIWNQSCLAEIQLDGYLLYKEHAFLPTPAAPFPAPADCGRHSLSMLISGSTFSSAVAAILASGLVHANFQTGKYANDSYYGQFVPGLKKYGDLPLYANLTLLNTSTVITNKEMRMQLGAKFDVLVETTPSASIGKRVFAQAFEMVVTVSVGLTAWLGNISTPDGVLALLYMNFTTARVDGVTLSNSSVGTIAIDKIHELMQQLMSSAFSTADETLTRGILVLPNHIENISLLMPELIIGEGYLALGVNVGAYHRNSSTPTPTPSGEAGTPPPNMDDQQAETLHKAASKIDPGTVARDISGTVEAVAGAFTDMLVVMAKRVREVAVTFTTNEYTLDSAKFPEPR